MTLEIELLLAALALAAGGILKGATGAGAPVLAVPMLALIFDVRYAVALMVVPNLITNFWQWWQHRDKIVSRDFVIRFAGGGALGALAGSFMLAWAPQDALLMGVGVVLVAYIAFRLFHATWSLPWNRALTLSGPAGVLGGILQGASGLSAPASITFLNSVGLERRQFIPTISVFFMMMSVMQIPALASLGILTGKILLHGALALAVLLASMPVGNQLARHVKKETFDKIILALLALIAAKILVTPFF